MTLAVVLLTIALLVVAAARGALTQASSGVGDPELALAAVTAVSAAALVSMLSASTLLLLGDASDSHTTTWQACWAFLGHTRAHPLDELAGAGLTVVLAIAAVRAGVFVWRAVAAQRRVHRAHAMVWRTTATPVDNVVWLEHDRPFAYSVPGRPGLIVASTGLQRLPSEFREAVLHHEHHHLRRRHHILIIAARAVRHAVGPLPLLRKLPRHIESLAEHAADDYASRWCGREAVHGALRAIDPEHAGLRLDRLATPPLSGPGGGPRQLTVLALTTAPVLLGAVTILTC